MSNGDDKVGYCRPPRKHQFRKGQSGNPKGRAKGSKNLETILRQELERRVTVSERGQRRTYSKLQLIIRVMGDRAATGNIQAFRALMALALPMLAPAADGPEPRGGDPIEIPDNVFEAVFASLTKERKP